MSDQIKINASMVRDYVDRELGPREERAFEERMLEDEQLLAQVQSEMALRRGLAAMARQDRAERDASAHTDAAAKDNESGAGITSLAEARARRAQPGGPSKR